MLIAYSIKKWKDPETARRHEQNDVSVLNFAVPAFLDTIGSFLNFTGLSLINASTYQIMKMSCMIYVVLLSVTIQDRSYQIYQYMALAVVISGFFVVTLADIQLGE